MPDTKISALTAATSVNGTEVLPIVQSATTKKSAISLIKDYITGTANTFTASQTIASGTLTASAPALDVTQTWNASGATFTGIKFNVTDTASQSGSLLMDFQVGGTSQFRVDKSGRIGAAGSAPQTSFAFYTQSGTVSALQYNVSGANAGMYWTDVNFVRDAANTLAQRNGTNAQVFRVYNTFTSDTNFERGKIEWASNVLRIGTEKGSLGGTARALEFQTDGSTRLTIATSGVVATSGNFVVGGSKVFFDTGGNRGAINAASNGVFTLLDNTDAAFNRLQFGGTTSSYPSIKRSGTTLQARLADDSGFATLDGILSMEGTAPTVTGDTGTAGELRYDANYLYVCTAANTWKRVAIATW